MDSQRHSASSAASSPVASPSNLSCDSSGPSTGNPFPIHTKTVKPAIIKVEPLPAVSPIEATEVSSPSPTPNEAVKSCNKEVMARRCSWCAALHTEQTAAIVTDDQCFCNELCFAHSRRARFKRCKGGNVSTTSADDSASSTGVSKPILSGPSSSGSSSLERTPSNSVSPRGGIADRSPNPLTGSYPRGFRHRLVSGSLGRTSAAPSCCAASGTAMESIGTIFPGVTAPTGQTVFVPVPLPIPIPIFKSAPELLDIMRRYNFRPGTPPPVVPQAPPPPLCILPGIGQPSLIPTARVTDDDTDAISSDETDSQVLDLSLPKGLDADLRHLTEASYYKSRRQLILDKPYSKNSTGAGHFHRRSFKAMRRK